MRQSGKDIHFYRGVPISLISRNSAVSAHTATMGAANVLLFVLAAIYLSLGIASIAISQYSDCSDTDEKTGLSLSEWLLAYGINLLALAVAFAVTAFEQARSAGVAMGVLICGLLFNMAWFIVGGVVLFRANVDCIRTAASLPIFALVMWSLSAFSLLRACCMQPSSRESSA